MSLQCIQIKPGNRTYFLLDGETRKQVGCRVMIPRSFLSACLILIWFRFSNQTEVAIHPVEVQTTAYLAHRMDRH